MVIGGIAPPVPWLLGLRDEAILLEGGLRVEQFSLADGEC
jgi:hypothetical protein